MSLNIKKFKEKIGKYSRLCFYLFGKDTFLLEENKNFLISQIKRHGPTEIFYISENNVDWEDLFSFCQNYSLISINKILIISLSDFHFDSIFNENLFKLVSSIWKDYNLILCSNRPISSFKEHSWSNLLIREGIIPVCTDLEENQLLFWIVSLTKSFNLRINQSTLKSFSYYYSYDLLSLFHIIKNLSLFQTKRGDIPTSLIEKYIEEHVCNYLPHHWIHAIFEGKMTLSLYILKQLRINLIEPISLLNILHREIMMILKNKDSDFEDLYDGFFKKNETTTSKKKEKRNICNRIDIIQLMKIISFSNKIRKIYREHYQQEEIWLHMKTLTLLIFGKKVPEEILNVS